MTSTRTVTGRRFGRCAWFIFLSGCLGPSCLTEDQATPGPAGPATDPAHPSGGDPGNAPPPRPPGTNVNRDPNDISGMYLSSVGYYGYIWPDGRFVNFRPEWDENGNFDYDLSMAKKPHPDQLDWNEGGQLEVVGPHPRIKDGKLLRLTFTNGRVSEASIRKDGSDWRLSWDIKWGGGLTQYRTLFSRSPIEDARISGTYARTWSRTTNAMPGSGMLGVDIVAGGGTIMDFKPNNRVYFKHYSTLFTNTVVGTGLGGSSSGGPPGGLTSSTSAEGEGSYVIQEPFMTITFDNGDVMKDVFSFWSEGRVIFGSVWAAKKPE